MRKLILMCVFVLFLTACAKTNAQEIPQKEKEVVIVDTTKKETQTLGDATIKKETVVPTEVKKQEEKPTVEQPKKEEVKQKEENKNTKPVQPQPKKEVKVEQKPAPKVEQSKPIVKPEVPKSLPKPPVASAKLTPTPVPEKPTPTKYCNYTGNRKALKNLCISGSFWISNYREIDPNSYPYKKRFKELQQGVFDSIVFHGETDRYHLIEDEDLRNGLKKTPESLCYIEGSCVGFKLP